jgi:asparagine synthase (glutamine-hydrolysing)
MCGIIGIVDFSGNSIDPKVLIEMRDSMIHRGPNDCGCVLLSSNAPNFGETITEFKTIHDICFKECDHFKCNVGFGHRRLAIIDLSECGRQPMSNENGSIWITFNGEIYNFKTIRAELEQAGHHFRSQTDTEVIIHAYEQWGMSCLDRFIGMFAFGLWDSRKKELILARDRIGVKPLYYTFFGSKVIFASEIKSILKYPGMTRKVNEESFYHYLSFFCVPPPSTLFEDILKVEAGHYIVVSGLRKIKDISYWDMFQRRNEESLKRSEEDICQELLSLFEDATRFRMISDVPFGAFLSGGIDSSLNVAVMSKILNSPVNTFSIGFEDAEEFNELNWARQIAEQYKTRHHEIIISHQDALGFLQNMVYYQDEPIADSVCVPVYFVSKLAKENGVTVCQVGEGSDELFCGYPTWIKVLKDYSNPNPMMNAVLFSGSCFFSHILNMGWGKYDYYHSTFLKKEEIFWGGAIACRDRMKQELVSSRIQQRLHHSTVDLISKYKQRYKEVCYSPDPLSWLSFIDLKIRLPELLLMRLDKMNMAVSLEGRVPFLDHRLVELVMSLSQNQKLRNQETKYILKKAIRGILPDNIIDRPKQGFQLPVTAWYQKYLHNHFYETLDSFLNKTDFFNKDFLTKFIKRKEIPWIIINFVYWYNMWIDKGK